jgi:hypothetical protein
MSAPSDINPAAILLTRAEKAEAEVARLQATVERVKAVNEGRRGTTHTNTLVAELNSAFCDEIDAALEAKP